MESLGRERTVPENHIRRYFLHVYLSAAFSSHGIHDARDCEWPLAVSQLWAPKLRKLT